MAGLTDRRAAQSVAFPVKTYASRLGLDADAYSGHSLRSGFLTSAATRGALLFNMMDVSRHKSVDVLRGYVRDAEAFRHHAGAGLLWSISQPGEVVGMPEGEGGRWGRRWRLSLARGIGAPGRTRDLKACSLSPSPARRQPPISRKNPENPLAECSIATPGPPARWRVWSSLTCTVRVRPT
jgi:hypothetical protein